MIKKGLQLDELNKILKKWINIFQLEDWKISLEITDFKRKDFRQSGDIKIDMENKTAILLMTCDPFRNEESTIIHELIHLVLWKYDTSCENIILKNYKKSDKEYAEYMNELESAVAKLTNVFLDLK